eukprot:1109572-Pleurochrysis_carterae.AAC.1
MTQLPTSSSCSVWRCARFDDSSRLGHVSEEIAQPSTSPHREERSRELGKAASALIGDGRRLRCKRSEKSERWDST